MQWGVHLAGFGSLQTSIITAPERQKPKGQFLAELLEAQKLKAAKQHPPFHSMLKFDAEEGTGGV